MSFELRPYQEEATSSSIDFLHKSKPSENGLVVIPTGGGKSLVISETIKRFNQPSLILQPSIEILEQNYEKYTSYNFEASIFSASAGQKEKGGFTTFATIGSIMKHIESFRHKKLLLVDEGHLCNPKGGMYDDLIRRLGVKVIGYTATPYRLSTDSFGGSQLKFLTRTRPKIFHKLIHCTQTGDLYDQGFLAPTKYFSIGGLDRSKLLLNTTGADFIESSLQKYYEEINFPASIERVVKSLAKVRKNILVFTQFTKEAHILAGMIPGSVVVDANTPKKLRKQILIDYKSGKIQILINVGVFTTGVDYPELETIVIAKPTMSLGLWYQMIGRGIRPHLLKKECWVIDMGDNLRLFGRVQDMIIKDSGNEKWIVQGINGKQLTNEYYAR